MMNFLRQAVRFDREKQSPELILILIIFSFFLYFALSDGLYYTPDSARYVIWSNSIAQFDGFADATSPEPARYVVHAPLYPIVLAPVALFFPNSIIALKIATGVLSLLLIAIVYGLIRRQSGRGAAAVGAFLLIVNPLMMVFSTQILSEVLFGISLMALFLLLDGWSKTNFQQKQYLFGIVAALAACVLSREIGLVLLFVVVIYLASYKHYEHAATIFFAVVIIYAVWFFRNEVIVAGREKPELRNLSLIGSHILTSIEDSMWNEFLLRMKVNGAFYWNHLTSLIFYPQYNVQNHLDFSLFPLIDRSSGIHHFAQKIVTFLWPLLASLPLALAGYGIFKEFREQRLFVIHLLFVFFYVLLILIYPVFDIRFLFPLLLLFIIWISTACADLFRRMQRGFSAVFVIIVIVASIPNTLWGINFANELSKYEKDPIEYHRHLKNNPAVMTDYTKPFRLVADWIRRQEDSSEVIISRWKELGIFLPGKKIQIMDSFTPLSTFEQSIREASVKYFVTTKDDLGWHEYEFQMNLTKQYSFHLAHSVADFDVYEVKPYVPPAQATMKTKDVYKYIFHLFNTGKYDSLLTFFQRNASALAIHPNLRFLKAVTFECAGELDSAQKIFEQLYRLPQGMAITRQIGFHQNVIDKRMKADSSRYTKTKAGLYLNIGLNYWELDLRNMAFQYLNKTIEADSNYVPAYNLYIFFALTYQDTLGAARAFAAMSKRFPTEPIVSTFSFLFARLDSIRGESRNIEKSALFIRLAGDYDRLGLSEKRLESMLAASRLNPIDIPVVLETVRLYEKKSKYYAAAQLLKNALSANPQSDKLKKKYEEIIAMY